MPARKPQAFGLQMFVDEFKHPPTKIMRLKKMPETADRRLVGHRLAAKINTYKPPHRERIIERSNCHMVDMLMAALLKSV